MAHSHTPGFMPPDATGPAPHSETEPGSPTVPADTDTGSVAAETTASPTTGMAWTFLGAGLVVLAAILVFILQNGRKVEVRFLMLHGQLPLGVALLFAVVLGALLVLVVGATRLVRRRVRR